MTNVKVDFKNSKAKRKTEAIESKTRRGNSKIYFSPDNLCIAAPVQKVQEGDAT